MTIAAVRRRFAVIERLRRALFAPPQLLTLSALAFAFAGVEPALAQNISTPNINISVAENGGALNLEDWGYLDVGINYDSTISLDGGLVWLRTDLTAPTYDAQTKTLYLWNLGDSADEVLSEAEKDALCKSFASKDFDLHSTYGEISNVVLKKGHYFDLSQGGMLEIGLSTQTDPSKKFYEDALGINVASQDISGLLIKSGGGALSFSGEEQANFSGGLFIQGGSVNVKCDAVYDTTLLLMGDDSALRALQGNQTFNCDVSTMFGGSIDVTSQENAKKVFNKTVFINGGSLAAWGDVSFQQAVAVVDTEALTIFSGNIDGLSAGVTNWGESSSLTIENAYNVYANANCLDVDIVLGANSALNILNVDKQLKDSPMFNKFFVTVDENQTPTVLPWTAGRANIDKATANGNVISKNLFSTSASAQLYFTTMGRHTADQTGVANGYTVVFNNEEGKNFNYAGMTIVDNAFMVVQGDANFGAHNPNAANGAVGKFTVFGEAYSKESANEWRVYGSGMLGFDRDDDSATSAPSITADVVEFTSGLILDTSPLILGDYQKYKNELTQKYVAANGQEPSAEIANEIALQATRQALKDNTHIGGARIWIDATYNGDFETEDKTFKLGAINANSLVFADTTQIWYDGIAALPSDVGATFDLNVQTIIKQTTSGEVVLRDDNAIGFQTHNEFATPEYIETLFSKPLVDASFTETAATDDGMAGTIVVSAKNVGDYAQETGMTQTEQDLARKLDGARVEGGRSGRFYDALYNENDPNAVRQTIHNLSLLGYNMLNAQGHFGNPTSSFFGGANISGEAKRGQDAEDDWNPDAPEQSSAIAQAPDVPKHNLWAAYTHTSVDGDAYQKGGVTMYGYDMRRDGVVGGIRNQIDATTSAGLFFGLSFPEIRSRNNLNAYGKIANNGYGSVGSNMEMTDFQFAGHFEKVLADVWELSAYVGGGTQAMDWERDAYLNEGGYYKYEADGTGNTLTATFYLAYRADLNDSLTLRPTVGVDSEHSWLYGFSETQTVAGVGGDDNVLLNPFADMFAQTYAYKQTYYNRNTARVGLSLAYSDPTDDWVGLKAQAFYGVKLGGDDAPKLSYYSDSYRWDDMSSHAMGDSSFNVGGGGYMHLNEQKTLTATGDVNAVWYKNAQTFNVTGGVSYTF